MASCLPPAGLLRPGGGDQPQESHILPGFEDANWESDRFILTLI